LIRPSCPIRFRPALRHISFGESRRLSRLDARVETLSTFRAGLRSKDGFPRLCRPCHLWSRTEPGAPLHLGRRCLHFGVALLLRALCVQISYYTQGQHLAALLDLSIRHDCAGARSVDDLMRSLYTGLFKRGRGFTPDDVLARSSRLAGGDYNNSFGRYVTGIEAPPYDEIFGSWCW
jgi:hypothetical protein